MTSKTPALLELCDVSAGYKDLTILENISLRVATGETVCIVGRNGMGKTTLLSTVMGLTRSIAGTMTFLDEDISRASTMRRARLGVGFVPQEREVFRNLTVEENLLVSRNGSDWPIDRSYDLFPRLAERRRLAGAQLSGGEQQMLSIARALMGNPALMLLDEPSEGLAPIIVDEVFAGLDRLRSERELAIVLVEQHVGLALDFAPRAIAMKGGRIIHDGSSATLRSNRQKLDLLIGLAVA